MIDWGGFYSYLKESWLLYLFFAAFVGWLLALNGHKRPYAPRVSQCLAATLAFFLVCVIVRKIAYPEGWDFLGFWISAKVTLLGENPYDPSQLLAFSLPIEPPGTFTEHFLNVGFFYPPPSLPLFAWVGFFDFHTALVIWYAVLLFFLATSTACLAVTFFPHSFSVHLPFVAVLFLGLGQTRVVVGNAQVVFQQLTFLLLAFLLRNYFLGGVCFALSILFKPITAPLALWMLLRKKWKCLGGAVCTFVFFSLLSLYLYGFGPFLDYFQNPITERIPLIEYRAITNQSLLAMLLRQVPVEQIPMPPIGYPPYVLLSLIALIGVLFVTSLSKNSLLTFSLFVAYSTLVYPHGIQYCSALAIIPILALWTSQVRLFGLVCFLGGIYLLTGKMIWLGCTNVLLFLALFYVLYDQLSSFHVLGRGEKWISHTSP